MSFISHHADGSLMDGNLQIEKTALDTFLMAINKILQGLQTNECTHQLKPCAHKISNSKHHTIIIIKIATKVEFHMKIKLELQPKTLHNIMPQFRTIKVKRSFLRNLETQEKSHISSITTVHWMNPVSPNLPNPTN